MRTEMVKLDQDLLGKLERANYMAQATKSLYLEALDCGVAVAAAKEEYVRAFVELDALKCQVSKLVERPGLIRWDADFPAGSVRLVVSDEAET